MSAESNKALSRRVLDEAFNAGNIGRGRRVGHRRLREPRRRPPGADGRPGRRQGDHPGVPRRVPRPAHHDRGPDRRRRRRVVTRWSAKGTHEGDLMGSARDGQAGDGDRHHDRPDRGRPDRRELDELGHARDAAATRRRTRPGHGLTSANARRGRLPRGPSSAGAYLPMNRTSRDVSLASRTPGTCLAPNAASRSRVEAARASRV